MNYLPEVWLAPEATRELRRLVRAGDPHWARLLRRGKPKNVVVAAVANRFVRWLHHDLHRPPQEQRHPQEQIPASAPARQQGLREDHGNRQRTIGFRREGTLGGGLGDSRSSPDWATFPTFSQHPQGLSLTGDARIEEWENRCAA